MQSGTEEDGNEGNFVPRNVEIYEIYFSKLMPEAEEPEPTVTPSIETMTTESTGERN